MNMGSTMMNVGRLLLGSIGTSYSTALLSSKTAEFQTILAAKATYAESAARALIGRALQFGGGRTSAEAITAAKAGLAQYITAHATSYSFEAVFRTLGLWVAAALLVAFLLKRPTVHKGMHGLH